MKTAAMVVAIGLIAGCGTSTEPATTDESSPLERENGLSTNGIWENGIWENGIWENGIWENGIWENGIWENGIWENGIWENGIWENGIWENGIWENGIWENGIWENGIWENGIQAQQLRDNPHARTLLQYIYSCAMPAEFAPGYPMTTEIGPPGDRVTLTGSIGVAVNEDNTTWWESGRCDQSCQRWISACVLARTNAYGVHVTISMRAPDDAPQKVKDALAFNPAEASSFPLREGAFFGNIFQTTPLDPRPSPTFTGETTGLIATTPELYACAGPGSNIPEVTKRFCSSQGDQAVINVVGSCLPTSLSSAAACTEDTNPASPTFGSMRGCWTSTNAAAPRKQFKEVITVYLRQPIATCGNEVCEIGESAASCATDCRTGTWSKSLPGGVGPIMINTSSGFVQQDLTQRTFAGAPDGGIIVTGSAASGSDIVVDAAATPPTVLARTDNGSTPQIIVVKYDANGAYVWGKRFSRPGAAYWVTPIPAVAPTGKIMLTGNGMSGIGSLWVGILDANGNFESDATFGQNWSPPTAIAADAQNNIFISGAIQNTETFGTVVLTKGPNQQMSGYVVKLSPALVPQWGIIRGSAFNQVSVHSLVLDATGTPHFLSSVFSGRLSKVDPMTGVSIWERSATFSTNYTSLAVDNAGSVYVAGRAYWTASDWQTPTCNTQSLGTNFFITKFTADGTRTWSQRTATACAESGSDGQHVAVDNQGNVIATGFLRGNNNFGAGDYNSFFYPNLFAVSYRTSDGAFRWAKNIPVVLNGVVGGMHASTTGRVTMLGSYAGSMQIDGHFLVNNDPVEPFHGNTFLASFLQPPADTTPPAMTRTPASMTLDARSDDGAIVWFMPPTPIDNDGGGTTVACSPASGSMFPIGTTTVMCTGTNAVGLSATSQFTVRVRDIMPPIFPDTSNVVIEANTFGGAVLPFTATDQVDGPVGIACVPAAPFPVGTTNVNCTATDTSGNTASAAFAVTVTDTTGPVIVVPADFTTAPGTVTYTVTATDFVDGSVPVTCTPASGSVFAIGVTTVTCSASDHSSNSSTASFRITVIDHGLPTITVPAEIVAAATSVAGATATYAASATDYLGAAIPVACTPVSGSTFPIGVTPVTCVASDADFSATASFNVRVLDQAPSLSLPTVAPVEATGASGAVVTFTATASDVVDGSQPVSCTPASGSMFAIGTTTVSCSVEDSAHNVVTGTFTVTVRDTTAPVITVPGTITQSAGGGASANVTYTVSALDIVDGAVAVSCTPASGSSFALGDTQVTCTAVDAHNNPRTATFLVRVTNPPPTPAYSWSGVLQPINADGSSIFKLNSVVPVKFKLTGASAGNPNLVATLSIAKISNGIEGTVVEAVSNGQADVGNQFRYDASVDQYVFNMSTKTLTVGTYLLRIDMPDGALRSVEISLKK